MVCVSFGGGLVVVFPLACLLVLPKHWDLACALQRHMPYTLGEVVGVWAWRFGAPFVCLFVGKATSRLPFRGPFWPCKVRSYAARLLGSFPPTPP